MGNWQSVAVLALGALSACGTVGSSDCGSDADCKENRICEKGTCIDPSASDGARCAERAGPQQVASCSECTSSVHVCSRYVYLDSYRCLYPCETDADCHVTAADGCGYTHSIYRCAYNTSLVQYDGKFCQI